MTKGAPAEGLPPPPGLTPETHRAGAAKKAPYTIHPTGRGMSALGQ
jgi:hypothetical protein